VLPGSGAPMSAFVVNAKCAVVTAGAGLGRTPRPCDPANRGPVAGCQLAHPSRRAAAAPPPLKLAAGVRRTLGEHRIGLSRAVPSCA